MNWYLQLVNWYFSKKTLPYWCVVIADLTIVFVSWFVVYYFNYGGDALANNFWSLALNSFLCGFFMMIGMRIFHTYSGILRYSSFSDLLRVMGALAIGFVLSAIYYFIVKTYVLQTEVNWFFGIQVFALSVGLMWSMRILVKNIYDTSFNSSNAPNILIYGTRLGGIGLAKSIRSEHPTPYIIKGFVSRDEKMEGRFLFGVRVYNDNDKLFEAIEHYQIKMMLVSPLRTKELIDNQAFIDRLLKAGVKLLMMSHAEQWDGKSKLSYTQLRSVEIEDLLPRDEINVDMNKIGSMLSGRRILITGAAGSIGSEMVRQTAKYSPSELTLIDQAETPMHDVRLFMAKNYPSVKCETIVTSITNESHMEKIFSDYRPEYVFHAAAYKHVPMMEDNPGMAVQNNCHGTQVIADLAVKYGTKKFVMISTDKAVNPTNVMGCSKRICEIYCQSLNKAIQEGKVSGVTQFVTTRFGNVLGSNGSVIPIFREQIRKGGPLTVTHPDIIRFFMLIPEACKLVLEAGTMGNGGEIFVFDMGKPVRIADLAQRMIDLSGAKNVKIEYTGLRDGEKLYEEVLNDEETTKPTFHPKIKIASVREYDYSEALANEQRLYKASFGYNDMEIVKIMKEIVPEFKSKHSKYEQLD
ncbi:MAG: nucleoside-diphosphate sugar epimerase/dehydratase [Bacteroidales bacterium]|nr:nucleoside-diphosphate sugar epimerase/dehydratase [Bacteroidales bacterium]